MISVTSDLASGLRPAQLRKFIDHEDGAVTVDWVVLTAAMIGICMGVFASVNTGLYQVGGGLSTAMSEAAVADLGVVNDW